MAGTAGDGNIGSLSRGLCGAFLDQEVEEMRMSLSRLTLAAAAAAAATVALGVGGTAVAAPAGDSSPPRVVATIKIPLRAGTINSTFSFSNDDLAFFRARLHYINRTHFRLSKITLRDSKCDNRSVYADVTDQDGFIHDFANHKGCGHAVKPAAITLSDPSGVHYIYIRLYACNNNPVSPCSDVTASSHHSNPYW